MLDYASTFEENASVAAELGAEAAYQPECPGGGGDEGGAEGGAEGGDGNREGGAEGAPSGPTVTAYTDHSMAWFFSGFLGGVSGNACGKAGLEITGSINE